MDADYGVAVSPAFREGPLSRVSARAVHLYLHLASRAAHVPRTQEIGIGTERINVAVGEALVSHRVMLAWLGCGFSQLGRVLEELSTAGIITISPVSRTSRALSNQERMSSQSGSDTRSQNGSAPRIVASRIKVNGLKALPRNTSAPNPGAISNSASSKLTPIRELEWIDQQLAAEGR